MMFLGKMSLPRRTFLQTAGAAIALPFLEAMVPTTKAAAATKPLRFGAFYLPNGFVMDKWVPAETGKDFTFGPTMKPLEPFRDELVVVSGLNGAPNGGSGTHATGPASFLTSVIPKRTYGNDIYNGVSIDQVIARKIGQDTLFPSMEFATEDFSGAVGACETGYSCLYMNTIAWSGPTSPLPMEVNPRTVFERMFGGTGTLEQRLRRMQRNRSILDAVLADAARLQNGLGARDRQHVSDYLDNIREIERRIEQAEERQNQSVQPPTLPGAIPEDFGEHVGLQFELMRVAFQADITRVATFMMARELHMRAYTELGASEGHHTLSHHGANAERMAKFQTVNTYHVQLFAKFVRSLKDTPDGDGSLLDNSMLFFGNGMSWGTVHDYRGLPAVVVGGGNGQIRGGRHLAYTDKSNGNLLLALGQKAGVQLEKFGTGTDAVDL
jgi:hypothetical protein